MFPNACADSRLLTDALWVFDPEQHSGCIWLSFSPLFWLWGHWKCDGVIIFAGYYIGLSKNLWGEGYIFPIILGACLQYSSHTVTTSVIEIIQAFSFVCMCTRCGSVGWASGLACGWGGLIPSAVRHFFCQSWVSDGAGSFPVSVQPPVCCCICNICAHVKNPSCWLPYHCSDTWKCCMH